jgi:hypothetical protein
MLQEDFQLDVVQRLTRIEAHTEEIPYLKIRMTAVEKKQAFMDGAIKVVSGIWLLVSAVFAKFIWWGSSNIGGH